MMLGARRLGSLAFLFYILIFTATSDGLQYGILGPYNWASIIPDLDAMQGLQLARRGMTDSYIWPRSNEDLMDLKLFSIRDIMNIGLLYKYIKESKSDEVEDFEQSFSNKCEENLQAGQQTPKGSKKPIPPSVVATLVGNG